MRIKVKHNYKLVYCELKLYEYRVIHELYLLPCHNKLSLTGLKLSYHNDPKFSDR